jgi:hypothetical protein
MKPWRIWINFKPRLYADLFREIFQSLEHTEVFCWDSFQKSMKGNGGLHRESFDVIILSLAESGLPDGDLIPFLTSKAKILAFSPQGDYCLKRLPGEVDWEEIRPFGISRLISEVTPKFLVE